MAGDLLCPRHEVEAFLLSEYGPIPVGSLMAGKFIARLKARDHALREAAAKIAAEFSEFAPVAHIAAAIRTAPLGECPQCRGVAR